MMCLERRCLPIQSLNVSTCPMGPNGQVCSAHGVCNNEATCTCDTTWAGTDCSMPDPPKEPEATEDEGPKGWFLYVLSVRTPTCSTCPPASYPVGQGAPRSK
ncbi:hypothetical protein CRUP_027066 [Coryphaenoides rupestris]|nr:hypothetical protein CRUP_027066 [Coryphaenoides rupestris]